MDELLAQALALVSEDKRGQLANIIEAIVESIEAKLDVIGAYEAAAHLAYTRAAQIKGDQGTTRAVDELNALGDRLAECANRVDEGLEVVPCT